MDSEPEEVSRIRSILKENPKGLTTEEVAKKLPLNRTSTAKYLNTLLISGQAEMRTYGRAKVFTLSQRIPFSQMLNLSSDLLIVLDRDLSIKQVNEPLLKTFFLEREGLIEVKIENSPLLIFFEKHLEMIRESAKGTEITRLEKIEIQGKEFFFRMKMIPVVFDQGGQGLAIILQDITELKQYQQHLEHLVEERTRELRDTNDKLLDEMKERQKSRAALEESERKYRDLVENANSIILRVNAGGIISFFNEFAQEYFGISEQQVLGKPIMGTIIPLPDPANQASEEYLKKFLTPTAHLTLNEVECIGKNGAPAWVAWTIKEVFDPNGVFSEYLIVGIDITERKQVENALHQVNSKLNVVSSITRHDILNKLTIISQVLALLEIDLQNPNHRKLLSQADTATQAIARQIKFTRDYKDMGMEKADWQDVTSTAKSVISTIVSKDVIIDCRVDGLEIFADPWLPKVFMNIAERMIRGSSPIQQISCKYAETEDGLELSLERVGSGIPIADKEKIFERDERGGNGFGLFIAREILAITGLTIKETGDPDKGLRFTIQVPRPAYRITK